MKFTEALTALKTLSHQVHELEVRAEERRKAQHGRFNVFTTLLAAHDEVRLHTRFLHALLDPAGMHDCGDLFLRLFFETLKDLHPLKHEGSPVEADWEAFAGGTYSVAKEIRINGDQLDLLLESGSHVLAIENKIWAGEQANQIERYIDCIHNKAPKQGYVLYLTLDGKPAETHNGKAYLRISYREHILDWLSRCLRETYQIVPINQVLIQYQRVVQEIVGQPLESQAMDTIKDYIRHNPAIIKHHGDVCEAIKQLHVEILNEFAEAVIEGLKDRFEVKLRQGIADNCFGKDDNRGLVVTPSKNFYIEDHPFEIWLEHNQSWGWTIGIETQYAKKRLVREDELELLRRIHPKLLQVYADAGEHYTDATKTWNGTYWPCGWHNIIEAFMYGNDAIAAMFDPPYFKKQVDATVNDVHTFVRRFKDLYLEEIKLWKAS